MNNDKYLAGLGYSNSEALSIMESINQLSNIIVDSHIQRNSTNRRTQ